MKKILILFFILPFGFSVLPVFAAEATQAGETRESTKSASAQIIYELPYPGLLSDSPIYFIKVLRDKVVLFLTRDPIKKAEYHLLLADKRIHMAAILVDKGKVELAKETALKGENEYTLLVFLFKDIVKKPNKDLFERLEKSALKHQEVLRSIINKVDKKDEKTFVTVLEFSERNLEELKQIYKNY